MNPKTTKSWRALEQHASAMQNVQMRELFANDKNRAEKFSLNLPGLLLDYSKNIITAETLSLLTALGEEMQLAKMRDLMFSGNKINFTENRAVLHTALRNKASHKVLVDGKDVMPDVTRELKRMGKIAKKIRSGAWRGFSGKKITDVVNVGIGGSALGPLMVCRALEPYTHARIKTHFISNVDGMHFSKIVRTLDPATTLFIISSKTFTTSETGANANSCRNWFLDGGATTKDIASHFVAVSTNRDAVIKFGINPDNMFEMWAWVGGRYSLWSAIGLPIMLAIGKQGFADLLAGAYAIDQHFIHEPTHKNMPVIMALVGIWYNNFFQADTQAVLPYSESLELLPAYLQQLDMESNGKSVDRDGNAVDYATGPILWGAQGINGQHAFYQLIHQGGKLIPCDFITMLKPYETIAQHHDILLSNFIGQTEALMKGRTVEETRAVLLEEGASVEQITERLPHMVFKGNNPSNSIVLEKLDPHTLGMLIATYEHKVFTQGIIWNLNSFDQWGVELGKQLSAKVSREFDDKNTITSHDSSSNFLLNYYKSARHQPPVP